MKLQIGTQSTVVIGGGQAGLAASYYLKQFGKPHIVVEANQIGHSWLSQRWDSFKMNGPNHLSNLPGLPFRPERPAAFSSSREFLNYLENYRKKFQLPVREGCKVLGLSRHGDGFVVETAEGSIRSGSVIVANGSQNVPVFPEIADNQPSNIAKLHVADYRSPEKLASGAVLIVGGGQSGAQIAEELAESGREVFLATSRVGRQRRRYRGRDVMQWGRLAGWAQTLRSTVPEEAGVHSTPGLMTGTKGGHTISLQSLQRSGVTLVGRLKGFHNNSAQFADDVDSNMRFADSSSQKLLHKVDEFIKARGIEAPPANPDPADEPVSDEKVFNSLASVNLTNSNITSVIWATGFNGDYSWVRILGALDNLDTPIHNSGISPVSGLYWLGLRWLRTRSSATLSGVGADAQYIAEAVNGYLSRAA